jgi:hypothetical protein
VAPKKPDPAVYLWVLRRLGLGAAEAIAFEDSANGLRAARAAGLPCIVTPTAYTAGEDFAAATVVLRDLAHAPHAPGGRSADAGRRARLARPGERGHRLRIACRSRLRRPGGARVPARGGLGYTRPMRISPSEQQAIANAARVTLWPGTRVSLFGSRVDDAARGGDIDLLVTPPSAPLPADWVARRQRFVARLYRLLDERRIDVVLDAGSAVFASPAAASAKQRTVELVQT